MALALVAPVHAAAPTGGGRWWLTSLKQERAGGTRARDIRVWLPPSYDLPDSAAKRYPVVLFLHGWPGGEGNWPGEGRAGETLGRLIREQRIPELIGLFPDGNGAGVLGRSLWLDSWDGRSKLETFLVEDLVPWADRTLRTRADAAHRGIIGLSDGATAAFNLLMRHPDVFGAIGAHSGDYELRPDVSSGPLFGPEPGATAMRERMSPLRQVAEHAETLRHAVIHLDCGDDDEAIGDARAMQAKLDSLGIRHHYRESPRGHDWGYWRAHLPESLEHVAAGMR